MTKNTAPKDQAEKASDLPLGHLAQLRYTTIRIHHQQRMFNGVEVHKLFAVSQPEAEISNAVANGDDDVEKQLGSAAFADKPEEDDCADLKESDDENDDSNEKQEDGDCSENESDDTIDFDKERERSILRGCCETIWESNVGFMTHFGFYLGYVVKFVQWAFNSLMRAIGSGYRLGRENVKEKEDEEERNRGGWGEMEFGPDGQTAEVLALHVGANSGAGTNALSATVVVSLLLPVTPIIGGMIQH